MNEIDLTGTYNISFGVALESEEEQSDEELIRKVLCGNREVFRELVRRHNSLLYSCILRQVGSAHVAEELAQEAFVKAFIGLSTYRFEAKFSTWLLRIGLNVTSTYFASRGYRQSQKNTSFELQEHDILSEESPELNEERRRRLQAYQTALGKLPKHQREILVLCGIEGQSYQDAAALLKIPIGTVRSRLNKARLSMRLTIAETASRGER